MELARQLGCTRASLSHLRSEDGAEVDALLTAADGRLVGFEVRAGATVRREDFRSMRPLKDKVIDRFRAGLVLCTGLETGSFGDTLWCAPISSHWTVEGGN